jgi:hypothetical protein
MDNWIQVNEDLKDKFYFSDIKHGNNFTGPPWKKDLMYLS